MNRPTPAVRGFSLVEFMIAITVSLVVLAALTSTFVANSRARTELDRANQQIENGRYAVAVLADDLNLAGFWGEFDLAIARTQGSLPNPTTLPKPRACETILTQLRNAMPVHLLGYDNVPDTNGDGIADIGAVDENGDGVFDLDCLGALGVNDVRPNTDILVIRRVSTCTRGDANCPALGGAPYFQASLCDAQLAVQGNNPAVNPPASYRLDTNIANLNRTVRDCATGAVMRRYLIHIYFVANNDVAGDGIPTLKRLELRRAEATEAEVADNLEFEVFSLANGIENLQVEYGIDCGADATCAPNSFDSSPDFSTASPDRFTRPVTDPPTLGACTTAPNMNCCANNPSCMQNWIDVTSAKVSILARNPTPTNGYTDTKVYTLGLDAAGNAQCAFDSDNDPTNGCEAFNDGFRRHVYQSVIRLVNPATRRDQ